MSPKVCIEGCLIAVLTVGQIIAQTPGNGTASSIRPRPVGSQQESDPLQLPPWRIRLKTSQAADAEPLAELRARLIPNLAGTEALICVDILLAPDCHVYSLTQDDPRQTRIDVSSSPSAEVSGPARPSRMPDPVAANSDDPAESYSSEVSFFVPLQLNNRPNPVELNIQVRLNGMICSDKGFCLPIQDLVIQTELTDPVESFSQESGIGGNRPGRGGQDSAGGR